MIDILLNNDNIVIGSPAREEANLARPNDFVKVMFKPSINDLSDKLIVGIAETNGSEVLQGDSIPVFRNEAKEGGVNRRIHSALFKDLLAKGSNFLPHKVPILLVKYWMDVIRTRGFQGFKGLDSITDLTIL